jgi:hypothetical protein
MKMKPIEEGCRAVIIRDDNYGCAGKECVVGVFLGDAKGTRSDGSLYSGCDYWRIFGDFGLKDLISRELDLMRIDGYDESQDEESKEKDNETS